MRFFCWDVYDFQKNNHVNYFCNKASYKYNLYKPLNSNNLFFHCVIRIKNLIMIVFEYFIKYFIEYQENTLGKIQ